MSKIRHFATRTLPDPVLLVFEDEFGKRMTEEFTVKYRPFSPSFSREITELEKGPEATLAKSLAKVVIAIIDGDGDDLTDGTGEKAKLDEEFFDTVNVADNLKVLYDRIFADLGFTPATSPTPAPLRSSELLRSEPLRTTSSPEVNEADPLTT